MNKGGVWKLISSYKFNSVFVRNLILILILIIIPFLILSYIVYVQMNQALDENVSSSSQSSLNRTADLVDTIIRDTNRLAAQLSLQEDVQYFLLSPSISEFRAERIDNLIRMYKNTFDYIDSIYIYSELNHIMITRQYYGYPELFQETSWYEYYDSIESNSMFIQPRSYNNRFPHYLSLYHPVYLTNQYKLGVVVLNINIQGLRDYIGRTSNEIFENLYIIDNQDHKIIYNEDIYQFQLKFDELYPDIALPQISRPEKQLIGDEQFIISKRNLQAQDWSIVSFQPLTVYSQKLEEIWGFVKIFILVSVLLAVITALIISMRTYKPIKKIMTALHEPEKWKEAKNKSQNNELYYINNSIVDHMDSKLQLEKELNERLSHLNQAQTLALQAQVSPHFLSNTLESMKWMAMQLTGGENDISKMALSLSRLLRLTLGSGSQVIPISLEIELNSRYIEIMETRLKDTFQVLWDIDNSLLEYQTVQLTLQPLIENAIHHGVRPKNKQGTISIKIKDKGSDIYLEVSDNGVGMDEVTMENLNNQLDQMFSEEGKHVGLRNVNQRIKLIFGDKYGLKIISKINKGTSVIVNIPKYKST